MNTIYNMKRVQLLGALAILAITIITFFFYNQQVLAATKEGCICDLTSCGASRPFCIWDYTNKKCAGCDFGGTKDYYTGYNRECIRRYNTSGICCSNDCGTNCKTDCVKHTAIAGCSQEAEGVCSFCGELNY